MTEAELVERLDRIESKLDQILSTASQVGSAFEGLSSNPMLKSFLGKF